MRTLPTSPATTWLSLLQDTFQWDPAISADKQWVDVKPTLTQFCTAFSRQYDHYHAYYHAKQPIPSSQQPDTPDVIVALEEHVIGLLHLLGSNAWEILITLQQQDAARVHKFFNNHVMESREFDWQACGIPTTRFLPLLASFHCAYHHLLDSAKSLRKLLQTVPEEVVMQVASLVRPLRLYQHYLSEPDALRSKEIMVLLSENLDRCWPSGEYFDATLLTNPSEDAPSSWPYLSLAQALQYFATQPSPQQVDAKIDAVFSHKNSLTHFFKNIADKAKQLSGQPVVEAFDISSPRFVGERLGVDHPYIQLTTKLQNVWNTVFAKRHRFLPSSDNKHSPDVAELYPEFFQQWMVHEQAIKDCLRRSKRFTVLTNVKQYLEYLEEFEVVEHLIQLKIDHFKSGLNNGALTVAIDDAISSVQLLLDDFDDQYVSQLYLATIDVVKLSLNYLKKQCSTMDNPVLLHYFDLPLQYVDAAKQHVNQHGVTQELIKMIETLHDMHRALLTRIEQEKAALVTKDHRKSCSMLTDLITDSQSMDLRSLAQAPESSEGERRLSVAPVLTKLSTGVATSLHQYRGRPSQRLSQAWYTLDFRPKAEVLALESTVVDEASSSVTDALIISKKQRKGSSHKKHHKEKSTAVLIKKHRLRQLGKKKRVHFSDVLAARDLVKKIIDKLSPEKCEVSTAHHQRNIGEHSNVYDYVNFNQVMVTGTTLFTPSYAVGGAGDCHYMAQIPTSDQDQFLGCIDPLFIQSLAILLCEVGLVGEDEIDLATKNANDLSLRPTYFRQCLQSLLSDHISNIEDIHCHAITIGALGSTVFFQLDDEAQGEKLQWHFDSDKSTNTRKISV